MPLALRLAVVALASTPLLANLARVWGRTYEDSWICFRYARNVAEGHGLVSYPGGPPDEGYSDLLWVLLLVPGYWLGLSPVVVAHCIGIVAHLSSILAIAALTNGRWLSRGQGLDSLVWVVLGLGASTASSVWVTSGLETPLYVLLVVLLARATAVAAVKERARCWAIVGVTGFLLLNTRPEGVLAVGMAFAIGGVVHCCRNSHIRKWLWLALPGGMLFAGLVLALLIWKEVYFGDVRPNPYLVKGALRVWRDGWGYLAEYANLIGWLATAVSLGSILVLLGIAVRRLLAPASDQVRDIVTPLVICSFGSLHVFVAWYSGGDASDQFRYLTPAHAFVVASAAWIGKELVDRYGPTFKVRLLAGLPMVVIAIGVYDIDYGAEHRPGDDGTSLAYIEAVDRLRQDLGSGDSLYACSELGYVAYHVDAPVLDIMGLCQREVARTHKYYPLHDALRASRDFVLSRLPDVIVTHGYWRGADGGIEMSSDTRWCLEPYFASKFFRANYDYEFDLPDRRPSRWTLTFARRKGRVHLRSALDRNSAPPRPELMWGIEDDDRGFWVEDAFARVILRRPVSSDVLRIRGMAQGLPGAHVSVRINRFSVGDREISACRLPSTGEFSIEARLPKDLPDDPRLLVSLWTTANVAARRLWRLDSVEVSPH